MGCEVASEQEEAEPETMSFTVEKPNPPPPSSPFKKRPPRWSDIWVKNSNPLKHVVYAMKLHSLSSPKDPKTKTQIPNLSEIDRILLFPDEILLRILAKLPESQRNANSLVCKRWLSLQDRLVRSLKVLDWGFLQSGRLTSRFPNLTHVDLLSGSLISTRNSDILLNHRMFSVQIGSRFSSEAHAFQTHLLPPEVIDRGLQELANGCPNLRKVAVIGATELGLLSIAEECSTLQDLELHRCNDNVLRGIAACENLQVLKLVGNVNGFYSSVVSDTGLTILAQGCKRLVKLELSGCEGSFDGIKAIGQCCQMLEELIFCDHRMEDGWLAALSYCENLKTLKFLSCKRIDSCPGQDEYLGSCPTLERLHLQKCQLRDKKTARALFVLCGLVKEIVFQDCWGLENDVFRLASICRRVKYMSSEGCSLLTTDCLESVILSWKEIESLKVVACKGIKDKDISPALSTLFSVLKELKWRPDTKSLLTSSVVGTSIGKKGGRFFKRMLDHKLLHFDQSLLHL
ncbi:F-box domain containing protein [Parasponia andersonii]|uniref:F-box domain containing protein n=1 Tax=Parasponia andersonii TaxID=3476 RepID=A0A2P5BQE3_PARAD|nr:F-box domain containing protein [Parasponia andersonii]